MLCPLPCTLSINWGELHPGQPGQVSQLGHPAHGGHPGYACGFLRAKTLSAMKAKIVKTENLAPLREVLRLRGHSGPGRGAIAISNKSETHLQVSSDLSLPLRSAPVQNHQFSRARARNPTLSDRNSQKISLFPVAEFSQAPRFLCDLQFDSSLPGFTAVHGISRPIRPHPTETFPNSALRIGIVLRYLGAVLHSAHPATGTTDTRLRISRFRHTMLNSETQMCASGPNPVQAMLARPDRHLGPKHAKFQASLAERSVRKQQSS